MSKNIKIKNTTDAVVTKKSRPGFWTRIGGLFGVEVINTTLLMAIIVLFSILISKIWRNHDNVIITEKSAIVSASIAPQKNISHRKIIARPTVATKTQIVLPVHTKRHHIHYGTVFIDSYNRTQIKRHNYTVGNVYIENISKYILPCDTYIDGNLYIRNVGIVKFCGKFTVTGNVYVSRSGNFAPIPRNAKIAGNVIL